MSEKNKYAEVRNSFMDIDVPYFWTATINDWQHLLKEDEFKLILIQSLQWLCSNKLVAVYGYVFMPNHIHILWEQLQMNGKEYPKNSFDKFTAHQFLSKLKQGDPQLLTGFKSTEHDRSYTFWQRDPLAIKLTSREMASQKLSYMHGNPQQSHWDLCNDSIAYRFSSAKFYETGEDEFGILTNYMDRF